MYYYGFEIYRAGGPYPSSSHPVSNVRCEPFDPVIAKSISDKATASLAVDKATEKAARKETVARRLALPMTSISTVLATDSALPTASTPPTPFSPPVPSSPTPATVFMKTLDELFQSVSSLSALSPFASEYNDYRRLISTSRTFLRAALISAHPTGGTAYAAEVQKLDNHYCQLVAWGQRPPTPVYEAVRRFYDAEHEKVMKLKGMAWAMATRDPRGTLKREREWAGEYNVVLRRQWEDRRRQAYFEWRLKMWNEEESGSESENENERLYKLRRRQHENGVNDDEEVGEGWGGKEVDGHNIEIGKIEEEEEGARMKGGEI